jgi:hypothetical protein
MRVVLAFDLEPVPRLPVQSDGSHWDGFRASVVLVRRLREGLSRTQSVVPSFTWLVRMDPQIERVYGHFGWIAERFAADLDELERDGDEIGLHTHLYRWDDGKSGNSRNPGNSGNSGKSGKSGWVTEYRSVEWMQHCVEGATRAYQATRSKAPRSHSFGDRYSSEQGIATLDALGFDVDMTVEPGFVSLPSIYFGETLLGPLPDTSRAPRGLWRPSHEDYLRDDPGTGRRLRLLPVTSYRFPRWMEPGRRVEHLVRRLRGEHPGQDEKLQGYARLSPSQRGYVFRDGARRAVADGGLRILHVVLRVNQLLSAAASERVVANLKWLAGGGLGEAAEFVSASRLLDAVDGAGRDAG